MLTVASWYFTPVLQSVMLGKLEIWLTKSLTIMGGDFNLAIIEERNRISRGVTHGGSGQVIVDVHLSHGSDGYVEG